MLDVKFFSIFIAFLAWNESRLCWGQVEPKVSKRLINVEVFVKRLNASKDNTSISTACNVLVFYYSDFEANFHRFL